MLLVVVIGIGIGIGVGSRIITIVVLVSVYNVIIIIITIISVITIAMEKISYSKRKLMCYTGEGSEGLAMHYLECIGVTCSRHTDNNLTYTYNLPTKIGPLSTCIDRQGLSVQVNSA